MSLLPSLAVQLTEKLVEHPLTGARPHGDSDGVDIFAWKLAGGYGPVLAQLYLEGTAPATIGAPAGGGRGVELWGFKLGRWWLVGALNDGEDISIVSDALGVTLLVAQLGAFDRLFVAGAAAAGAVRARFAPLEVLQ